jgi:hypothetical protein
LNNVRFIDADVFFGLDTSLVQLPTGMCFVYCTQSVLHWNSIRNCIIKKRAVASLLTSLVSKS